MHKRNRWIAAVVGIAMLCTMLPASALHTEKAAYTPKAAASSAKDINEAFKKYDPFYPQDDPTKPYKLTVPTLQDRLTLSEDQQTATLFAPYTNRKSGWNDADKVWDHDGALCWAAGCANLISWYLRTCEIAGTEDVSGYEKNPDEIFKKFKENWNPNEGYDSAEGMNWYFTGGFASGGPPQELLNPYSGAYLKAIEHNDCDYWSFIDPTLSDDRKGNAEDHFPFIDDVNGSYGTDLPLSTHRKFSETIIGQLHFGPTVLNIGHEPNDMSSPNGNHAITLWGCDYDVNTGLVNAVYLVDSDDDGDNLMRVEIHAASPDKNGIRMYFPPVKGDAGPYTRIVSSMMMFCAGSVSVKDPYTGPETAITDVRTDTDGVTVTAAPVNGETLEYGYAFENSEDAVKLWQDEPYFSLQPDTYYFFVRVKENEQHKAGVASAGHEIILPEISPQTALQTDSVMLGASGLKGYHAQNGSYQYIWYGNYNQQSPILWRILADEGNDYSDSLLLLTDKLYGRGRTGNVRFSYYEPPTSNEYQGSAAQSYCMNFENHFTTAELSAMHETTKSDNYAYSPWNPMTKQQIAFRGAANILFNERLFFLSVEEMQNPDYGFINDESRKAKYHGEETGYWLRSPKAEGVFCAGHVDDHGYIFNLRGSMDRAARPAFNLNKSQILYTTAIANSLASSDVLTQNLLKNEKVNGADYKLTLLDASRLFTVPQAQKAAVAGDTLSFSYSGAKPNTAEKKEFITVILTDAAERPVYFGRVAQPSGANGQFSFTLPSDLATGTYTLNVCNEQCNAGKATNYASAFSKITLQVESAKVEKTILEGVDIQNNTAEAMTASANGARVEIQNADGTALRGSDRVGTGAVLSYYDSKTGRKLREETVILYGDVDGDGAMQDADYRTVIEQCAQWTPNPDENALFRLAADVNHDGAVDAFDASLLHHAIHGNAEVRQNSSK